MNSTLRLSVAAAALLLTACSRPMAVGEPPPTRAPGEITRGFTTPPPLQPPTANELKDRIRLEANEVHRILEQQGAMDQYNRLVAERDRNSGRAQVLAFLGGLVGTVGSALKKNDAWTVGFSGTTALLSGWAFISESRLKGDKMTKQLEKCLKLSQAAFSLPQQFRSTWEVKVELSSGAPNEPVSTSLLEAYRKEVDELHREATALIGSCPAPASKLARR